MDLQHKVCFSTKTTTFESLNVFVDNKPIKVKKSKCIWYCDTGNHTIRIEQYKIIIFGILTCLSIAAWIFLLNRYYKWSKGEY
jgi:hypothetical protein